MSNKYEMKAVVVRDSHDEMKIIDLIPIRDSDDEVSLSYPITNLKLEDIEQLKKINQVTYMNAAQKLLYRTEDPNSEITISGKAYYLPSIGNIHVSIETKEVEWK